MKRFILLMALVSFSCSTPSSVKPISVPLQYKLMASPAEFAVLPACAAISRVDVVDKRMGQDLGKRFVEGTSAPAAPVTTTTDVAAWTRTAVEEALKRGGVTFSKQGAPSLQVSVEQIVTNENVLHRSGYEGRIVLLGELRGGNGAPCWQGRGEGSSQNYGYSGSVENYQETLNHALDRAVIRLLDAGEFRKAVCGPCS